MPNQATITFASNNALWASWENCSYYKTTVAIIIVILIYYELYFWFYSSLVSLDPLALETFLVTEMTIGVAFGPADEADLANSNGYILSLSQGGVVLSAVDIPPGKRTLNFHAIPILFALPASKHVTCGVFLFVIRHKCPGALHVVFTYCT